MESDLSRVVDALPGLVWTALPNGDADFVNQRWCEYTGLTAQEAYGRGWLAAIHPDDLPALVEGWLAILASGEARELEARMRRSDGAYRWFAFRARPLRDNTGHVVGWCGINTDIEERKRAEDALRARASHFRSIADAIPALIAIMSPIGEVVNVNRHVLDYFGLTLDELKDWAMSDAVHPDDLPDVVAAWMRSVQTREPYDVEHRMRRVDGVYRWFHVRGVPLQDADGTITRWYVLQTDIDDRKQAEEQLAAEKRLLEASVTERRLAEEALDRVRSELAHVARVTSLGALTASIAHEVNQPLSAIVTNANTCLRLLAANPPNVERASEAARRMIGDSRRASEVIARLRRLFAKKQSVVEAVDLNEAVREVIALTMGELHRSRVTVQLELTSALPLVTGDRVQLQQVILNLLLNAAEAMRDVDDRPRQLLIRTSQDDAARVSLVVRDSGIGFDPEIAEQLFDAFYTTKSSGMGIGLSVSREIIDSHHGRLWATSNEGPGATFAFSLPYQSDGAEGRTETHATYT